MDDSFLLQIAEISAGLVGLFLVGAFFYIDSDIRRSKLGGAMDGYMRAGTRIVLIVYAIPLGVPLTLVGIGETWGRLLFLVNCAVLVIANVDTVRRIRTLAKEISSFALVANEAAATVFTAILIVLPWTLGGWRPTAQDLTPSLLLALGTGFLSTCALVMVVFDMRGRIREPDQPERDD